jgi:hypothetical protein
VPEPQKRKECGTDRTVKKTGSERRSNAPQLPELQSETELMFLLTLTAVFTADTWKYGRKSALKNYDCPVRGGNGTDGHGRKV